MELRQLVYFETVARLGGFSRAARELHIAQPAVSAAVRRLEGELGTALFERTTRRVRLTPAGTLLLGRVRTVLRELSAARSDLEELADVLRGQLRLGITQVLGSFDLPGMLAEFHRDYPGVALAVRSALVADLLAELDTGSVDALIAPIHHDLPDRYTAQALSTERLTLITAPGHLRNARGVVSLSCVRDDLFVCLAPGSGLHTILGAAAAEQGFAAQIPFEAPDPASIRRFVAAGLGVGILAESAARVEGPAIDVYALQPALRHPDIGLIRLRDQPPTPALRAWLHQIGARSAPVMFRSG